MFAVILTYPPPISRFSSLTPQLQTMEQPLLEQIRIVRCCCSPRTLKAWLPILSWLPRYNLRWLQMDLMAGLTVGLTVVPQALAYAEVAALPVQVNDFFLLPFLSYITFYFHSAYIILHFFPHSMASTLLSWAVSSTPSSGPRKMLHWVRQPSCPSCVSLS